MIIFRAAKENDLERIREIINEFSKEHIELELRINNTMIALNDNLIVGVARYIPSNDRKIAYLDLLAIKKEFQGQYIGDALVKSILNLADKRGVRKVYVFTDRMSSLFFKKVGFIKRTTPDKELLNLISINNIPIKNESELYEAKLPDFFNNKSCKSFL